MSLEEHTIFGGYIFSILMSVWIVSSTLRLVLSGIFRGIDKVLLAGLFDGTVGNLLLCSILAFIWIVSLSVDLFYIVAITTAVGVFSAALAAGFLRNSVDGTLLVIWPHRPWEVLRQSVTMMFTVILPQISLQATLWVVASLGNALELAQYGLAIRFFLALSTLMVVSTMLGSEPN